MGFVKYSAILLVFVVSCNSQLNNCTLLSELEYALYNTGSNEQELNQAFFPPRKATSRYIMVIYDFQDEHGMTNSCNVKYIWAIGGFLLIQPPAIFQFLSLLFSYPANDISDLTITLPQECRNLVSTTDGMCSCKNQANNNLDILTQQIMQYSKFVDNSMVVRDENSVARSICFEEINADHFNKPNITLYLSASLILPVAVAIPSVGAILKYYKEIKQNIKNPITGPNVIGVVLTGIYITIYMLCMDITAIYMYASRNHEYGAITTSAPLSLHWSYATLIVECSVTVLIGFIILACTTPKLLPYSYKCYRSIINAIKAVYTFFYYITTASLLRKLAPVGSLLLFLLVLSPIVLVYFTFLVLLPIFLFCYLVFFSPLSNQLMVSFIIIPIIFVSAHMDYIFAAWLTEPSKTTSVVILALTIILFLFVMSRTLYSSIKSLWFTWHIPTYYKNKKGVEGFFLTCTFLIGFLGVALVSLHVTAFFILPIPTVSLADYLENIVQISLVILASLITYKIISIHESDTSKFLKQLTQADKVPLHSLHSSEKSKHEVVNFLVKLMKDLQTCKIKMSWDSFGMKTAFVELEEAIVYIQLDLSNKVLIPTSHVNLYVPSFPFTKTEVHTPLEKAKLEVVFGDDESTTVNISLRNTILKLGEQEYPASQMELRLVLPQDDTRPGTITLAKSPMMYKADADIVRDNISLILPCYVVKTSEVCKYPGSCIRFDNSVTLIKRDNDTTHYTLTRYVLTDTTTLQVSATDDTLTIGSEEIALTQSMRFEGHNITAFMYHLKIPNKSIVFQYIDGNRIKIKTGPEENNCWVDIPIEVFELRLCQIKNILCPQIEVEPDSENPSDQEPEAPSGQQSRKRCPKLRKCFTKLGQCCKTKYYRLGHFEHKLTLRKKPPNADNNGLILEILLDDKSICDMKLDQDANKEKKLKIQGWKNISLNVVMDKAITIDNFEKISWGDPSTFEIQSPRPYDLKIQPESITYRDTSYLYFTNAD